MIRVHVVEPGSAVHTVTAIDLAIDAPLPPGALWIDLLRPTEAERDRVEELAGVELPSFADMQEIEASSRLYARGSAHVLTVLTFAQIEAGEPEIGPLTFVLTDQALITIRYLEPRAIANFAERLRRYPGLAGTPLETLVTLIETMIDRSADVIELTSGRLDILSRHLFADEGKPGASHEGGLQGLLRDTGRAGDLLGKIRHSLASLGRVLAYLTLIPPTRSSKDCKNRLKTVARDVSSLVLHADFQNGRITFLLDAVLGMIQVEQNNIVKSFSVAAVAFLPPTLIASIYGMNFDVMPELAWPWGYPFALLLMLASAVLPTLYFKRRGWL
jgi:magnesium transporter